MLIWTFIEEEETSMSLGPGPTPLISHSGVIPISSEKEKKKGEAKDLWLS